MQAIRNQSIQILTKGQKAAIKSDAENAQIKADLLHKDTVIKTAFSFINGEVVNKIFHENISMQ